MGCGVLENEEDGLDIVLGTTPISLALNIPEQQLRLQIPCDSRSRARDLARHKVFSAPRRFVVVKNAVANKEAVRFSIHLRQLCGKSLGASIRARRAHRRALGLGNLTRIPENFRTRSMIKSQRLRLRAHYFE